MMPQGDPMVPGACVGIIPVMGLGFLQTLSSKENLVLTANQKR